MAEEPPQHGKSSKPVARSLPPEDVSCATVTSLCAMRRKTAAAVERPDHIGMRRMLAETRERLVQRMLETSLDRTRRPRKPGLRIVKD